MKRCCSIVFLAFITVFEVKAKSLIFSKYGTSPYYGARRPSYDLDFDDMQDNERSDVFGYKRSIDGGVHPFKRSIFGNTRKRSPYGLVYNQGKPIGILEPIGQAFEYASYPAPRDVNLRNTGFKSQWYPSKRESAVDMEIGDLERADDDLEALHSSNYANVLAKFKVNNKVKHRPYRDFICAQQVKRNAFTEDVAEDGNQDQQFDPASLVSSMVSSSSFSNPTSSLLEETASSDSSNKKKDREELKKRGALDLGDLTSDQRKQDEEQVVKIDSGIKTSSKVKRKVEEKIGDVDENLKEVMDDLNFIEKDGSEQQKDEKVVMKKREIYFEDEDLENGLNKIGLTKESHFDRNKKEDTPLKSKIVTKSLKNVKKTKVEKSIHKKGKKKARKDSDEPKQRIIKSPKRFKGNNYNDNYGSKITKIANYQSAGEEYLRKKRQAAKDEKAEKGDSEIMKGLEEASGDLTVSGNKSPLVAVSNDEIEKKSQEKRDKEELEYEKRLERNIEDKINAIKEEVKREISRLQADDEEVDDPQRKKREITNNLMECETSNLDPGENIEEDLEPHIRKRRGTEINNSKNILHPIDTTEEKSPKELEENAAIVNNEDTKSKSEESVVNKRQEVANEELESEPKEKPLNKRASNSGPEIKEEKEEEEDKENSDEDDEAERETSMIKRNQKKEREKEKKKIAKEEDSEETEEDKNVNKRDAYKVTEKIENNEYEEASTDNINKRNDIEVAAKEQTEIDGVIADANSIVKRNEEEQTTNKFIIPRAGVESSYEEEEENRQERSVKEKYVKNLNNQKDSKGKEENLIENTDDITKRDQRSPEQSSSKPITNKEIKEKQKRSTNEVKDTIPELEKPAASKSVILNEQELGKENQIEERSATETEDTKELPASNQEKSNLNQDSSQADKEENNEVNQNVKKVVEEDETNLDLKEKQTDNLDVKRKRRSLYNAILKRSSRRKRDGSWNDHSNTDSIGYRADDGEIDEEDDEMQDDGFDDQTSNLVNKRSEYEDLDGPDYPTYMERNKRNALRLYDDEVGEDESFDNFLFYPKKYSRAKRHDNVGDNVVRTRNNKRRKRREQEHMERLRGDPVEKSDITELSEADIFGGLPQSYEGELSRFKRVKRSRGTEK